MPRTLTRERLNSLGMAASHYHQQVAAIAPYLLGRGVSGEMAGMFRLGYVGEPLLGDEDYVGRLAIPYLSPAGVTDIRFRCVQPHDCKDVGCAKYLGRPGVETGLYNVRALWEDTDTVAVCEGEIDAMTLSQVVPTVGLPGANAWRAFYARLLADFDRVVVVCDGDEPGHQFGRTILKAVDEAVVVHCPPGHDANDLWRAGGADALERLIGAAR